jgi:hypothetical protein
MESVFIRASSRAEAALVAANWEFVSEAVEYILPGTAHPVRERMLISADPACGARSWAPGGAHAMRARQTPRYRRERDQRAACRHRRPGRRTALRSGYGIRFDFWQH